LLRREEDEDDISFGLGFQQGGTFHRRDHEGLRKVPYSAGGFLKQSYRGKTTSLTPIRRLNLIVPQTCCLR